MIRAGTQIPPGHPSVKIRKSEAGSLTGRESCITDGFSAH